MGNFLLYTALLIIWTMLLYHLFLMIGGYAHFLRYKKEKEDLLPTNIPFPKVSIMIPAYNEAVVIEDTIKAMVQLTYPKDKLEVIIINDNSSDQTGKIIDAYAKKYSFIIPVHNKPPFSGKGKSGALNRGLKVASGEVIVIYDADNTPEPEAIQSLALPLLADPKAGAIVGKFRVVNANTNLLTRLINAETLTFQWLAQAGRWFWFKMATIPGTNFAIRKKILDELGGWDEQALSEDTELSIRVYNAGYYIRFFPEAVAWEQEPETLNVWWKQRTRWARGNIYVIFKYIFQFHSLKNKKVFIDLYYFLFTYFLFFTGILLSHGIFITNLFFDLRLKIGIVSLALLCVGFLLFVTEVCLALSMEKQQFTFKNFTVVLFMYFTYSQMWLFLVIYASLLECKRVIFRQEVVWYKTKRFKRAENDTRSA